MAKVVCVGMAGLPECMAKCTLYQTVKGMACQGCGLVYIRVACPVYGCLCYCVCVCSS